LVYTDLICQSFFYVQIAILGENRHSSAFAWRGKRDTSFLLAGLDMG